MHLSPSLAQFMSRLDEGPRGAEDAIAAIQQCANAESPTLDLQQMGLTDADLAQVLPHLSAVSRHVTSLNLFMNELTVLPAELGTLSALTQLHAGCNPLEKVHPSFISALPKLEELDLGFSEILELLPDVFDSLPMLRKLFVGNGRLSTLPPTLFTCSNLEELHAYGNCIKEVDDGLGHLRALRILNVGRNQISSLPASTGDCASLQSLHVYENSLSALPASITKLSALQVLNTASNEGLQPPPRELAQSGGVAAIAAFYATATAN